MKKRFSAAIRAVCLLTGAAVLAGTLSGCSMILDPDIDLESILQNMVSDASEVSGMPVVVWDENDPDASYKELLGHLSDLQPKVAVSGHEEFGWEDICYSAFWVNEFSVTRAEGKSLRVYEFSYNEDADMNVPYSSLVDMEADDIISKIPAGADDWEKALVVHDELVRRVTYEDDENDAHRYDIYGALVNHQAVCQGYTYAMRYILDKLDIPSECISSETHIWNRMPDIGGNEKYIDITWDDTDELDENGEPYIFHNCFMITGEEMERLEDHYAEKTLPDDGDKTGGNYFRHRGGIIPKGKTSEITEEISRQMETGTNLVELRFVSKDDYSQVCADIDDYVYATDYDDSYMFWSDDDLRIISIGLHPADE